MMKYDLQIFASSRCVKCSELQPSLNDDIVQWSARIACNNGLQRDELRDFMLFLIQNPEQLIDLVYDYITELTPKAIEEFRNEKENGTDEFTSTFSAN